MIEPTKCILVVEDDPDITELLTQLLEAAGYTVKTAVDGAAIPLARDLQPALVLVDIRMPGMDGVEVCRRLRADERTRAIPLVLMSAAYRLRERAGQAPVDALLSKPFSFPELLATVEQLAGPPAAP
jgi:putative two-component system response regulator